MINNIVNVFQLDQEGIRQHQISHMYIMSYGLMPRVTLKCLTQLL